MLLLAPPADLTSAHVQSEMTDEGLFDVISDGVRHHSMPAFADTLSEDQRWMLVGYVRSLSPPSSAAEHDDDDSGGHGDHHMMQMKRAVPWPQTREASGTAWLPDSSPMFGLMRHDGDLQLMVHGSLFTGPNAQGTSRGDLEWTTVGWVMPMLAASTPIGFVSARAMFSPEPFTLGGDGYALLFQTGETFEGQPLQDRQHPHDLVMEAAVHWLSRPLPGDLGFELYGGPVGEPALGPAAFPHRLSAMSDPLAPIGHHWLDSTHIVFGVVTAAVISPVFKIEGSWFNGHEPDENRLDLDLDVPESWSTRLSVNPQRNLSLQASYGHLVGPEPDAPDEEVERVTASVAHNLPLGERGNWASLVGFGHNRAATSSSAALAETNLNIDGHNVVFGRAELVGKEASELGVLGPKRVIAIPSAVAGYEYVFDPAFEFVPALGFRASAEALVDDGAAAAYGTRLPLAGMVYLHLRGARMMDMGD